MEAVRTCRQHGLSLTGLHFHLGSQFQEPGRPGAGPAWLAGPYCESSDVIIEELPLPAVQAGELIAVWMSGAYHVSRSSNYNGACRPAVVWPENGTARLVRRREEPTDLVRRDLSIEITEDLKLEEA